MAPPEIACAVNAEGPVAVALKYPPGITSGQLCVSGRGTRQVRAQAHGVSQRREDAGQDVQAGCLPELGGTAREVEGACVGQLAK